MDFEAWLTIGALVTGVLWALDKWVWAKRRTREEKPNWAVEFSSSFFPVLIVVLLLRAFVVEPFRIPSKSMVPALLVGDFILVNKFSYGLRLPVFHTEFVDLGEPERGDVMVFRYPPNPTRDYIKRVIGLPGDQITYRDDRLYINGDLVPVEFMRRYRFDDGPSIEVTRLLMEDLPGGPQHPILDVQGRQSPGISVTVPPHHYFVMGDNRDNSADSRVWGFVPQDHLVGEAFMIWMSIDFDGFDVRWSRIGNTIG